MLWLLFTYITNVIPNRASCPRVWQEKFFRCVGPMMARLVKRKNFFGQGNSDPNRSPPTIQKTISFAPLSPKPQNHPILFILSEFSPILLRSAHLCRLHLRLAQC